MFRTRPRAIIGSVLIVLICGCGGQESPAIQFEVTLSQAAAEQIADHIKGGSWRDKAGAYAIQETGDEFVEKIEGSMTNVMGLPMELLESLLVGLNLSVKKEQ